MRAEKTVDRWVRVIVKVMVKVKVKAVLLLAILGP